MNIEDRLIKIYENIWALIMDGQKEEDYSDRITAEIIEAFKNEGWDYSQDRKIQNVGFEYIINAPFKPVVKKFIKVHGYMTGAEWYDKYRILAMSAGYYSDDLPMMKLAREASGIL